MHQDVPIGLAAVEQQSDNYEMREFYIIPAQRGRAFGRTFAHQLFTAHPGAWVIKQIERAHSAVLFWQKTITASGAQYKQDIFQDPYWGAVTRQQFTIDRKSMAVKVKANTAQ
jgi:predicted acetyltransferase